MAATATFQLGAPMNLGERVTINGTPVPQMFTFTMYDSKAMSTAAILGDFASATRTQIVGGTATTFYYKSSDNAQDKAGGTGCLTFRVHGFDVYGNYQYEDITTVGTTEVTGTLSFGYNPFYMEVLTAGSGLNPEGNILCGPTGLATVYNVIPAGKNHSSIAMFDLPPNVMAVYDLSLTGTIATTNGDGIYVSHLKYTDVASNATVHTCNRSTITAELATMSPTGRMAGFMAPHFRHQFYGEDIGTTAQTLAWGLTWGFKYA